HPPSPATGKHTTALMSDRRVFADTSVQDRPDDTGGRRLCKNIVSLSGPEARQEQQAGPTLESTLCPHFIELPWLHQGQGLFYCNTVSNHDDDSDSTACKVLLIAHIVINGEQNVESCFLCFIQQPAVFQAFPMHFTRSCNVMARQLASERFGDAMIKENLH